MCQVLCQAAHMHNLIYAARQLCGGGSVLISISQIMELRFITEVNYHAHCHLANKWQV